ncbi:hypothetical protein RRG08_044592 [Elysia crispata]|uniref:Uncharacterized protein n=1 Tax=Elysia crispata TaxID=231223 RepID=A0AAE0ZTN5_9GAST|nr:hypothetical protein RRG08_044592 [Elysia crispata]
MSPIWWFVLGQPFSGALIVPTLTSLGTSGFPGSYTNPCYERPVNSTARGHVSLPNVNVFIFITHWNCIRAIEPALTLCAGVQDLEYKSDDLDTNVRNDRLIHDLEYKSDDLDTNVRNDRFIQDLEYKSDDFDTNVNK